MRSVYDGVVVLMFGVHKTHLHNIYIIYIYTYHYYCIYVTLAHANTENSIDDKLTPQ